MNTPNHAWIDQPLPDVAIEEQRMDRGQLAKFGDILRFSSEYWGGVWAFVLMAVLIVAYTAVVTNEGFYEAVRQYVIYTNDAFHNNHWMSFFKRVGAVLAALAFVGTAYAAIVRYSRFGAERVHAWGLVFLILVLITMDVKVDVELINWSGDFWEDFKNKDIPKFVPGLLLFSQLAFFSVFAAVYRKFFIQTLQIRWRTWLTERYTTRYLEHNRFYQLEQIHGQDNPDQRIADDLSRFTELSVGTSFSLGNSSTSGGLFFGFYLAGMQVYEFSKVMLKLSGSLDTHLFGHPIHIPYYMFFSVVLYAILGSIAINWIGRRLVKINILRERFNANFRYHLIHAREYAEGISFLQGNAHHLRIARELFATINANWHHFMWRVKFLNFGVGIFGQSGVIFPIIMVAPRYFSGGMNFGNVMQVLRTFGNLCDALSSFVNNYGVIAEFRASATRIFNLDNDLKRVDAVQQQSELTVVENNIGGVALTHTSLSRPQKTGTQELSQVVQVADLDWQVSKGERWIVTGASGAGKSTILRAIAGLWYFGTGRIDVPTKGKMLFLPQKPYMPIGTLREALSYPDTPARYNDAAYVAALTMSQLPHLSARLDEQNNWAWLLSGGEQQRLSFARLFLQRPAYVFLDEATSALDEDNERTMYHTLLETLPDVTLISVSHHEQLRSFHHHRLHLEADARGGFHANMSVIVDGESN